MQTIKIVYFGDSNFTESCLLNHLSLVEYGVSDAGRFGLYLALTDNQLVKYKRVIFEYKGTPNSEDVFLIYKELSKSEVDFIKKYKDHHQIYMLVHKMLDLELLKYEIFSDLTLILADSEHKFLKDIRQIPVDYNEYKKVYISVVNSLNAGYYASFKFIPYFLLNIFKVILNPFDEIRLITLTLIYKLYNRTKELYMILYFVLTEPIRIIFHLRKKIFFPLYKTYWFLEYQYYKRIKKRY